MGDSEIERLQKNETLKQGDAEIMRPWNRPWNRNRPWNNETPKRVRGGVGKTDTDSGRHRQNRCRFRAVSEKPTPIQGGNDETVADSAWMKLRVSVSSAWRTFGTLKQEDPEIKRSRNRPWNHGARNEETLKSVIPNLFRNLRCLD